MDEGVENCCTGGTGTFLLPPDISSVPLNAKELEQTHSPSHKPLIWPANNSSAEHGHTEALIASKDSKIYKMARVSPIKTKHSQPRILALLACISYLLFHFLGLDLGVRLIIGYTEPRLHQAEVQLQAATSGLIRERLLHLELDSLLSTTMDQCHMESYENCLVRGLYEVNTVFLGMDFMQYADIRNTTMEWITNNCGRIMHTPQLFTSGASNRWTQTANMFRWLAEKTLELFRCKTTLLWCKWTQATPRLATKTRLVAKPNITKTACKTANLTGVPAEMPFGFTLECGGPLCRLVYSEPSNSTTDGQTFIEVIAKAHKDINKWTWPFGRVLWINSYMIALLSFLQSLLGVVFLFVIILSRPQSRSKLSLSEMIAGTWPLIYNTIASLQEDEQLVIGLIINTTLYALLHWELAYMTSEFDRPLLPVGIGLCAFHVFEVIAFFNPISTRRESMRNLWRSMKEMYLIAKGHNFPRKAPRRRSYSSYKDTHASADSKPASVVALRFISPLTSLFEDIQQERKAMYVEQGKQSSTNFYPDNAHATEHDSEYELYAQHTSYINLISCVPPAISEDGSNWSVVEE